MIVFSLIIILAVAYAFYFFLGKNKNATEIQSTGLTNEQRTTIIKELDSGEKTDSITAKERTKITKELNTGFTNTKPITDSERNSIINSLN